MYKIKKRLEIAIAHSLDLNYESKCRNTHGHNLIITVYCKNTELNDNGMVIDFTSIKEVVNQYDHKNLNDVFVGNPTAENLAKYLCDQIPYCYRVDVQESEGNIASYIED